MGAVLMLVAIIMASGDVMCRGEAIHPGEVCGSWPDVTTYEQELADTRAAVFGMLVPGALLFFGAVARIVVLQRRRRNPLG
ncbi:hypothetical protein [Catellatospora sp. TT07R-123]|uniref:hypothetical protein n=1 Tax=Catellatospora sp. TT07R-123 TaxID=2733863 RepID=UPI001BB30DE4|nr:hypothetical protein [Catellatospora sp. TT07R-123]